MLPVNLILIGMLRLARSLTITPPERPEQCGELTPILARCCLLIDTDRCVGVGQVAQDHATAEARAAQRVDTDADRMACDQATVTVARGWEKSAKGMIAW